MLGAVQLGALAACIVLFVPMGMAGWHLSRNKMLFFSGALFITLAVGVHLTPYFPAISYFLSSVSLSSSPLSSSVVVLENRDSCISLLHDVVYDVNLKPSRVVDVVDSERYSNLNNVSKYDEMWSWERSGPVMACGFQRLGRSDASDLLNGSWVVVAGDSQARMVAVALLSLVLSSEEMEGVRSGLAWHTDYQTVVDEIGMKVDFKWAPYVTNITDMMIEFKETKNYPDVLVIGAGLWHMLHVTSSTDYGDSLQMLRDLVIPLVPISPGFESNGGSVSIQSPHLFWLGMPMLINSMLNTEEKREKMTDAMQVDYQNEIYRSKLLRESGGPLLLLDLQSLSRKCGMRCTLDGMHYDEPVYQAAVQILLNALLIESHQKL